MRVSTWAFLVPDDFREADRVTDEVEVTVSGYYTEPQPATRYDPPVIEEIEDVEVVCNGLDVTEDLTKRAYELLCERLLQSVKGEL
jgi:hypothetical protein